MFYDDFNALEALFFHMHVSYQQTLTKIYICLEHMLTFYTLNGHILIIKRDSDNGRSLGKIVS